MPHSDDNGGRKIGGFRFTGDNRRPKTLGDKILGAFVQLCFGCILAAATFAVVFWILDSVLW